MNATSEIVPRVTMHLVSGRLVERGAQLDKLRAASARLRPGAGEAVLVTGEAGIGKSTLVRTFTHQLPSHWRVLAGGCDDLLTPRPLGPLRDVARDGAEMLSAALAQGRREDVLEALPADLADARPTLLVVEDVHWADDATIDALRYLARRLDRVHALVVLTFRPDDVPTGHPLHALLGELGRVSAARIPLPRLTSDGIRTLGALGPAVDVDAVLASTGGNPFFVTEVLAAPEATVPATVVDAVLSRIGALPEGAREALEQLAVFPTHVELGLAAELLGGLDALAQAERRGILTLVDGALAFRHELARRAVEHSLPMIRRLELNRAAVAALRTRPDTDLSLLVHHAVQAGDLATVVEAGPAAAREAARASAHRQALAHYEAVLRHADRIPVAERADLLQEYASELYVAHRFAEGARVAAGAVALRGGLGDDAELTRSLVALCRHRTMAGDRDGSWQALEEAAAVAARSTDPASAALVAANRLTLLVLDLRFQEAIADAPAAIALARAAERDDLVAMCLNYQGSAQVSRGDATGLDSLRESRSLALRAGDEDLVGRAYINLNYALWTLLRLDEMDRVAQEGLAWCMARELPAHAYNIRNALAERALRRGAFAEAEARLGELHADVDDPGFLGAAPRRASGLLLARTGRPGAGDWLGRVFQDLVAEPRVPPVEVAGRFAPDATALVEWCWLENRPEDCRPLVDALHARAALGPLDVEQAELMRWLLRAGLLDAAELIAAGAATEPVAAGLRGDWRAAAEAWAAVGAPYERALELVDSGDVDATLAGVEALDLLEAAPAARIGRLRLRALGVTRVPRGPHAATRANPAGLTERQLAVLELVAEGLTNAEIAERLVLSTRTVDHHVSAVLGKLGVASRQEAARLARTLDRPAT